MKVYVLLSGASYEGYSFEGVFSTAKAAKQSIKEKEPHLKWRKYQNEWQTMSDPWYEVLEREVQK